MNVAIVASVTNFEDGHRAVSFRCPNCTALHDNFVWPDGGLRGGNILAFVHCNGCSWRGNLVVPAWALNPRRRGSYASRPREVFAGGDFGRDDQAQDIPLPNWDS